jgi:hypothetical protein
MSKKTALSRFAAMTIATGALVLLAACGAMTVGPGASSPGASESSQAEDSARTSSAVSMSSSATAKTTRWTMPQAQQHYLDYITYGDADYTYLQSLPCTCHGQVALSTLTDVCLRIVADNTVTADDFADGAWPTVAIPSINALVAALHTETAGYQECADATSLPAATAGLRDVMRITPQAIAARKVLGLPTLTAPTLD